MPSLCWGSRETRDIGYFKKKSIALKNYLITWKLQVEFFSTNENIHFLYDVDFKVGRHKELKNS